MNNKPLVSVVVPCYNHDRYVEQCIESIVNQTYDNVQLIVIDDGSSDNSVEILSRLSKKYDFLFESQKNMGLCKTLNKAIKNHVKGEYVCFIASDDYWDLEKLDKQIEVMMKNDQCVMSYTYYTLFSDDNIFVKPIFRSYGNKDIFKSLFFGHMFIGPFTVMLKTSVFDLVGLYDESLVVEDLDMWLRISNKYREEKSILLIPEYTAYYRQHQTNMSKNFNLMYDSLKKICDKWPENPLYRAACKKRFAEYFKNLCLYKKADAFLKLRVAVKELTKINLLKFILILITPLFLINTLRNIKKSLKKNNLEMLLHD